MAGSPAPLRAGSGALRRGSAPSWWATVRLHALGLAVLIVGAALVILSLTGATWFRLAAVRAPTGFTFADVGQLAQRATFPQYRSVHAYFTWLAWALLAVTLVAGVTSQLRSHLTGVRAAAIASAAVAIVTTVLVVDRFAANYHLSRTELIHALSGGMWFALAGFTLIGMSALIGPRQPRLS